MTLSPEARAKALLADLKFIRWPSEAEAVPLIATAIREAEDAALERAASLFLDQTVVPTVIRALKHKD